MLSDCSHWDRVRTRSDAGDTLSASCIADERIAWYLGEIDRLLKELNLAKRADIQATGLAGAGTPAPIYRVQTR